MSHDYRSSPVTVRAVYLATNGHVVCLDPSTGAEQWRREVASPDSLACGLIVAGDILFVAFSKTCARLAARDGAVAWRTEHAKIPSPNVITVELDVPRGRLVIAGNGEVAALAADDGEVVWTNGLEGLGYNPIVMRVPGAIGTRAIFSESGDSISALDDGQSNG